MQKRGRGRVLLLILGPCYGGASACGELVTEAEGRVTLSHAVRDVALMLKRPHHAQAAYAQAIRAGRRACGGGAVSDLVATRAAEARTAPRPLHDPGGAGPLRRAALSALGAQRAACRAGTTRIVLQGGAAVDAKQLGLVSVGQQRLGRRWVGGQDRLVVLVTARLTASSRRHRLVGERRAPGRAGAPGATGRMSRCGHTPGRTGRAAATLHVITNCRQAVAYRCGVKSSARTTRGEHCCAP